MPARNASDSMIKVRVERRIAQLPDSAAYIVEGVKQRQENKAGAACSLPVILLGRDPSFTTALLLLRMKSTWLLPE